MRVWALFADGNAHELILSSLAPDPSGDPAKGTVIGARDQSVRTSADRAIKAGYALLCERGFAADSLRSFVSIDFEGASDDTPVSGDSAGAAILLKYVADHLEKQSGAAPEALAAAATGVVRSGSADSKIGRVDGIFEKIQGALASELPSEAPIFLPRENRDELLASPEYNALAEAQRDAIVHRLRPTESVEDLAAWAERCLQPAPGATAATVLDAPESPAPDPATLMDDTPPDEKTEAIAEREEVNNAPAGTETEDENDTFARRTEVMTAAGGGVPSLWLRRAVLYLAAIFLGLASGYGGAKVYKASSSGTVRIVPPAPKLASAHFYLAHEEYKSVRHKVDLTTETTPNLGSVPNGSRYWLDFQLRSEAYVYVFTFDSNRGVNQIFPSDTWGKGLSNPVEPGLVHIVPTQDLSVELALPPGVESENVWVRLIVSSVKRTDLLDDYQGYREAKIEGESGKMTMDAYYERLLQPDAESTVGTARYEVSFTNRLGPPE